MRKITLTQRQTAIVCECHAHINHNGEHIYLGLFTNAIDAAQAYDDAARKYHSDFAITNFPKGA